MSVRRVPDDMPILKVALPNVVMTYCDSKRTITVPASMVDPYSLFGFFDGVEARGIWSDEDDTHKFHFAKTVNGVGVEYTHCENLILAAYAELKNEKSEN